MTVFESVLLGAVQGLAEFLPVSSSGHLAVLRLLFGLWEPTMTFDIVVHLGSLTAVLVVFRKDIWALLKNPFQKMTGLLLIGTVPAVAAAVLFKDFIETFFHSGLPLALAFCVTGVALLVADRFGDGVKEDAGLTWLDALVIGCMQALALPPGVSRSGMTVAGALGRGLTREAATRFSFLLSVIAVAGAGVLQAFDILRSNVTVTSADIAPLAVGFAVSGIVGYLAIKLFLKLIKACRLRYFSFYVFALAAFLLLDQIFFKFFL